MNNTTDKPTRTMQRREMPVYEKFLTVGTRFRWMGANGKEYFARIIRDCRNGDYKAHDEQDGHSYEGYIEDVTEIHLPNEIILIPRR